MLTDNYADLCTDNAVSRNSLESNQILEES